MRSIDRNLHSITGVLILIFWKNFIYWQEYDRFSLEVFSDNKSHFFSLAVTNKAVSAWLAMWSQRKLLFFVLNFAKKRHSWELPSYILIVLQLLTVTSSHKKVKGKEAKRKKEKFTKWNLLKLQRQFLIVYMGPIFVWSHNFFFADLNFHGFLHNRMAMSMYFCTMCNCTMCNLLLLVRLHT